MSHFRPSRRAPRPLGLAALVSAATLAAACTVSSGDASSASGAAVEKTAGTADAAHTGWSPAPLTAVSGVPVAEVRTAVTARLAEARPAGVGEAQWARVRRLYKQFGGAPLWMTAEGPDQARSTALLKALVSADQDALDLSGYPLPELARAVQALKAGGRPTAAQLAEADVLMSSAYATLASNLLTGQTNPKEVSKDWFIAAGDERVDSAVVRSLTDPDLGRGIDRMRPQDDDYRALRTQLVRYRELAAKGDWTRVPAGRALMPGEGDAPARLAALRGRLTAEGLIGDVTGAGSDDSTSAAAGDSARGRGAAALGTGTLAGDGRTAPGDTAVKTRRRAAPRAGQAVYDAALAGGVATFQARHGIAVDSVLGPETVNALNVPVAYRLGQIATNLERHRWLPRDLGGRHVIVNVPAFKLEAWDGGRKTLEMKVVVGKDYEDRKTPVFADSMETVVFRPYWNITDDIAAKETFPKMAADPDYARRNRLETFQENGQTRIRQLPGTATRWASSSSCSPTSTTSTCTTRPRSSSSARTCAASATAASAWRSRPSSRSGCSAGSRSRCRRRCRPARTTRA
jgi:murein L,D-transpeptidase YcbB/YkuD